MKIKEILTSDILEKFQISELSYTEDETPVYFNEYKNWIEKKNHLPLNYLADHRQDLRSNLKKYFPEFKSAIVFLFSYQKSQRKLNFFYKTNQSNKLKIASYTLGFKGLDYHIVLRERLLEISKILNEKCMDFKFSLSIDMHPVLERDLAMRSGLGWFGKNSMLITQKSGSFFIIASILTNQKFDDKKSIVELDHCGQCTRCADACPTNAIDISTRTLIAKDCISSFTIEEFKLDTIPSEKMNLKSGFIFGCDICQDVCPWNKRIDRLQEKLENENLEFTNEEKKVTDFFLLNSPLEIQAKLEEMSNKDYEQAFKDTSFERSGKRGILKNFKFYNQN